MEANFLVQGSAAEPYEVTFLKKDGAVSVLCSCPAGENGSHCKHRIALMSGDASGIVSANKNDLAVVLSWLEGSKVLVAFSEYRDAESEYERATKRFSAAKRKLARVMFEG